MPLLRPPKSGREQVRKRELKSGELRR